MKIKPRDYQAESVELLFRTLKHDKESRPVIVLPTGAGKSVVAALICEQLAAARFRVVILCRTKELVKQNHDRTRQLCPGMHTSIYCGGLGVKDASGEFVFATAQSIAKNCSALGHRDLVLVDEAHQVPARSESQYQRIMAELADINPGVRLAGMTATPYRTDGGAIAGEGKQFSCIAYAKNLVDMVNSGWLVPIVIADESDAVDLSDVSVTAGDYDEAELGYIFGERCVQHAFELSEIARKHDRKSCIVFASTVQHANKLCRELSKLGNSVSVVAGTTPAKQRDSIVGQFKSGKLKFLVNVGVLTTGFDAPNVDMIGLCRATMSHGLLYQILGRGMRLHEGKSDCLVVDYGAHQSRLGDIYSPEYGMQEVKTVDSDKDIEPGPFMIDRECRHCEYVRTSDDIRETLINHAANSGIADASGYVGHWMRLIEDENGRSSDVHGSVKALLTKCPECNTPYAVQLLSTLKLAAKMAGNKPPERLRIMSVAVHVDRRDSGSDAAKIIFAGVNDKGTAKTHNSWLHFHSDMSRMQTAERWGVLFPDSDPPSSPEDAERLAKSSLKFTPSEMIVQSTGRFSHVYIHGTRF